MQSLVLLISIFLLVGGHDGGHMKGKEASQHTDAGKDVDESLLWTLSEQRSRGEREREGGGEREGEREGGGERKAYLFQFII